MSSAIEPNEVVTLQNDTQLDTAVHALAKMEEINTQPPKEPIREVEESLTTFLKKAMEVTLESNQLSSALEKSLIQDLNTMSVDEKLTLYNLNLTGQNDRLSKIINPVLGSLESSRQQTAKQENGNAQVQVNIGTTSGDTKVASETDPSVVSGLQQMFQLMQSLKNESKN